MNVNVNLAFLSLSMLYIAFLNVMFLKKGHIKTFELDTFGKLITLNLIGILLEFGCIFTIKYSSSEILIEIVNRLFLLYLVTFVFLFSLYVFSISFDKANKKNNTLRMIIMLMYLFSVFLIFYLKLDIYNKNNIIYSYGPSTNVVYIISTICVILCFVSMIKNYKELKSKKYLPLFVFIIGGSVVALIQKINPALTLATSMEAYLLMIMYHTIENPDMKMINELNIAKNQAVKANAAKTDFLSSMSHEIRTPLNAIVGFSESLDEENLPEQSKEEISDILEASNTLLDIVNGILDISKIEANRVEIVNSNYNFDKIFNELVALSKARLGDNRPIEFRYSMDQSIPDILFGDYARIKQVILNLLTNSIKYTEKGYIDFKVNAICNNNICRLIVSVEDSGKGIKKESINKLFTKFERLDERNTTIEGTGLGLAITKKLVEMMNGKIIVQSIFGKGSRFTVVLDQKIIAVNSAVSVVTVDDEPLIKKDLSNKKILIVDDNQLNLKVAARLLRNYNCQIEEVDSGFKTLDLIDAGNYYDLILMDDMMPKMTGTETLHRLQENISFHIPVVALTANAISGMREKYLSEGFNDYLAKPIEKDELTLIIKKYLDR